MIRAPSRTGSAAACSGQAWISARRPRPASGVSLCNCARRCGGGARLSHSSITRTTFPVESAALPGRRVARASLAPRNCRCLLELRQAKSTDGDTAACRRYERQAQHVDYSSSFVGRKYRCQFSISGARHLQGLLGDSQVMAGAPSSRHTRSLVLPDSQFTYKKRPIRPKETTRRVRHTATSSHSVPRARRRRRLQDGCPWRRPLGATIGNIHDRVFVLSTVAPSCTGVHDAARPRFGQLRPSWKTIAHLVIHFNNPNTPAPRPPIKPLAACKTLAQPGACCSPEHYIARTRTHRHAWPPTTSVKSEALRASQVEYHAAISTTLLPSHHKSSTHRTCTTLDAPEDDVGGANPPNAAE